MTITPPTQTLAPAEQAKALLAYAADDSHFFDSFGTHLPLLRGANNASTAMYAAQAATAHAMLAVADELAGLRTEMRQAVGAPREDLFQLTSAVRALAAAMARSAAQDADTVGAVRDLARTLADGLDGQTDQVEAVRDAVEEGLADIANVMEATARPRGGWWSRLLGRRTTRRLTPPALTSDSTADAPRSLPPLDPTLPVVPAIPAGQDALERLAYLREVLANWAVTLPDNPNQSGLRQGLAATVYEAWEATRAVIAQVVGGQPFGPSLSGPVQDAVLRLEAALQEMGPAGVPSMESVQVVSDRLTDLLKVVAAETVAARAEVDGR